MDYKKMKVENTAVTRNVVDFIKQTNNIYETLAILTKRSNQISLEMKDELNSKIEEFATGNDNLEEVFENREQIEISKYYERLPKPTLIAYEEFVSDQIYHRNPAKENRNKEL